MTKPLPLSVALEQVRPHFFRPCLVRVDESGRVVDRLACGELAKTSFESALQEGLRVAKRLQLVPADGTDSTLTGVLEAPARGQKPVRRPPLVPFLRSKARTVANLAAEMQQRFPDSFPPVLYVQAVGVIARLEFDRSGLRRVTREGRSLPQMRAELGEALKAPEGRASNPAPALLSRPGKGARRMGSIKAKSDKRPADRPRRTTRTRATDRGEADYAFDPKAAAKGVPTGRVSPRDVSAVKVSAPLTNELIKAAKESGRR